MDNSSVLIVLLIVAGVIVVVFMLRDRITKFGARASLENREGELNIEAAEPKSTFKPQPLADQHSVNISSNRQVGRGNVIEIDQSNVNVQDNLQLGEEQKIVAKSEIGHRKK